MTGVSKVASGSVQPHDNPDQVADKQKKDIREKHKHHHNFHGAHHHASEKERLKKLIKQLEQMVDAEDDPDDQSDGMAGDLKKMNNDHLKSGIQGLKSQYGLDDEKVHKHTSNLVDADNTLADRGDIVLSGGIAVLYIFMDLLSGLAQYKYVEMQQKAKVSRDSQNMANEVQEQIAYVSKQKNSDTYKVDLKKDVIEYMEQNDVKIDGKTIDDYLGGDPKKPTQLDKGGLDAVKSALENTSNRASDFVSQSQLQLQKVMQTYNVTVSLINSMQTLLEEMNKSIAQNIR